MRVIDAYVLAAEAYERWCKRYGDMMSPAPVLIPWLVPQSDKAIVAQRLKALGPRPTPEQVNKAVGNRLWMTVPDYFCCELSKEKVVEFQFTLTVEDELMDEATVAPVHLCQECLLRAFILIEES